MADALGGYGTSFELDNALRIDIDEMVAHLSPFDAPFLGTYNGLENTPVPSALPQGTVFETTYDWMEDSLLTPRSTLSAAHVAADGELQLPAGEGAHFQPDDLVRVKDTNGNYIHFRVTSNGVDYDTDILTVVVWEGTDFAVAQDELVEGVGTLPSEGADPPEARATDRVRRFNHTHIFGPYPVELTETEQVVRKYGVASEWAHQTAKRVKEATISMEQAIVYGTRKIDSTGKRRSMGGINYFIDTANGSTVDSDPLLLSDETAETGGPDRLLALQQGCYNNGGDPRLVVVGPANKPKFSKWRKSDLRFSQTEHRRGQIVTVFESEFGVVDLLMHRWVRPTDLFLMNHQQAEVNTLEGRNLKWVKTAKTGDRDQAYVICEKGFKFFKPSHAAKMTGLT